MVDVEWVVEIECVWLCVVCVCGEGWYFVVGGDWVVECIGVCLCDWIVGVVLFVVEEEFLCLGVFCVVCVDIDVVVWIGEIV